MGDRRLRPLIVALALAGVVAVPGSAVAQSSPDAPTVRQYLVMPHPDDEASVWAHVGHDPRVHHVVLYATRGEESSGCRTAAEGGGPYWFQGPDSPVGEPDHGEVDPLGAGTDTWQGRWSDACREGRIAGTLAFLDAEAQEDPTLPSGFPPADQPTAVHELPGRLPGGAMPGRFDNGVPVPTSEVAVYDAANGRGTVLFFDLGDGDLTSDEVTWALRSTVAHAERLGLPDLPDGPALGAFFNDMPVWDCEAYAHPDHAAVHTALAATDVVDGPRLGRTCSEDPRVDEAWTDAVALDDFVDLSEVGEDGQRLGSFQRHYGWLAATEWSAAFGERDHLFSRVQHFWARSG